MLKLGAANLPDSSDEHDQLGHVAAGDFDSRIHNYCAGNCVGAQASRECQTAQDED